MTPSSDATSLSFAQATILASSTETVRRLNEHLKTSYYQKFQDYVTNMTSGGYVPPEQRVVPMPPMAWELAPADENGFVFYQVGKTQVVPTPFPPPYNGGNPQPNKAPGVIVMGPPQVNNPMWHTALSGDTWPSGMETGVQSDGHNYIKFGAPVGAGWYLQIS